MVVHRLAEEVRAKLVHRVEADASQVHLGLVVECDRVAEMKQIFIGISTATITQFWQFLIMTIS